MNSRLIESKYGVFRRFESDDCDKEGKHAKGIQIFIPDLVHFAYNGTRSQFVIIML